MSLCFSCSIFLALKNYCIAFLDTGVTLWNIPITPWLSQGILLPEAKQEMLHPFNSMLKTSPCCSYDLDNRDRKSPQVALSASKNTIAIN